MISPLITTHTVWEDGAFVVMARIRGNDGALILQANVTTITGHVYDLQVANPGTTDLWGDALVVADTVFDTLQTTTDDPRWTVDTTGFNFQATVPASAIPDPSRYRCEIIFVPASGDNFPVVLEVDAIGLLSS